MLDAAYNEYPDNLDNKSTEAALNIVGKLGANTIFIRNSHNNIGDIFSQSLSQHSDYYEITLDYCRLKDTDIKNISRGLNINNKLRKLSLGNT